MPSKEAEATTKAVDEKASSEFRLYLMRHGEAVAREESTDDSRRALTADGKRKMKEIARGLVRIGLALDAIVSSPLVRAVETAEIVARATEPAVPVEQADALGPGASTEAAVAFLGTQGRRSRVLLVGHEPSLSALATRLIGGGRHTNLAFKKGGCCLITFDEFPPASAGELQWWLTPRIMRKLR